MRILFLAHRIPYPPNKGEKIRAFHELRFLAANHTIDLFCFADNTAEAEEQWNLRSLCRRMYVEARSPFLSKVRMAKCLLRGEPITNGYFFSPKFKREVAHALAEESYDLIFVYCSSMAQYVPSPAPAPVVVDFVDVDSSKWVQYARFSRPPLSWLYSHEARSMSRVEQAVADASAVSIVATHQEAALLQHGSQSRVETVWNGVSALPVSLGAHLPAKLQRLQPYVLFIGQMDYRPNTDAVRWFVNDILPAVRQECPEAHFVIAGRNPTAGVRRLAHAPGVIVSGAVPDVQPYLQGASVVVAPFRIAQGIQNKILEALAAGKPVVSTRKPAEAIGAKHGETLLIADSSDEFAHSVVELLKDPSLGRRFDGGPEFVRKNFDWQTNLKRLELFLEMAAGRSRRRTPGESTRVETQ